MLNQGDLSVHCSYHFSNSNVLRLRCNNTLMFLLRFQCENFKLGNLMRNPLFEVAFLNDQHTLVIILHISGCHISRLPFRTAGSGW